MRLSATDDIETGLVDLSGWGFHDVMALNDPQVVQAQDSLVQDLAKRAVGQAGPGGGGGSPHFAAQRQAQEAGDGDGDRAPGARGGPAAPGRRQRGNPC